MRRVLALAALVAAGGAVSLPAQVADTTRADSTARDTTDYTGLYLKAQQDAHRLVPVPPRPGAAALLPAGTRLIIDRDSILWHNAETVSDLLAKVPGVFLLRGGWTGRPELPAYQARGASSVEYVLDGIPYLPIGQDSVMVDPSLLPLSFMDRVEVERLPGQLRVFLFTRQNDRVAPFSRIGIATGDLQYARYQGVLQKRSVRGIGLTGGFDHLTVPAQPSTPGDYSNTQGWIRLDYLPRPGRGAALQLLTNAPDRQVVLSGGSTGDTVSRARHGGRRDLTGSAFWARKPEGLGPRFDVFLSRTAWTDHIEKDTSVVIVTRDTTVRTQRGTDSTYALPPDTTRIPRDHTRSFTQAGAAFAWRRPDASFEANLTYRTTWTPVDVRVRAGLAPNRRVSASLEGAYLTHNGSRSSNWLTARAGIRLPRGFVALGQWRRGRAVTLPAILADTAVTLDDRSVALSWHASFAEAEVTYAWDGAFAPSTWAQYPGLAALGTSNRTEWVTVNARVAPRQWMVLDGWYSTPQGARPEGQPPTHSIINGTIQSKFLPTFTSGIFNLKLQISMENWSTGTFGRDRAGLPVILKGATYLRGYIAFQIGAFTAYFDRYNAGGTGLAYVPGLPIPKYAQTFGVRWEFAN